MVLLGPASNETTPERIQGTMVTADWTSPGRGIIESLVECALSNLNVEGHHAARTDFIIDVEEVGSGTEGHSDVRSRDAVDVDARTSFVELCDGLANNDVRLDALGA